MKVPVSRPLITAKDTKQVLKSLENLNISGTSSTVQEFENSLGNYLDNKRALCVSSGTSAIDLMIESLFDKRAGNVIVPTFTIMSTVFQLGRKGIRLKLVDCNLDDWNMSIDDAINASNKFTQYLFAVHIYGLTTNIDKFKENVKETEIIEDIAESLGQTHNGKLCGTLGKVAAASFYANKIITSGEGGAVITSNDDVYNKVKSLRNLSFSPTERFVHSDFGWNLRMNGLSAALGCSQLQQIDKFRKIRFKLAMRYYKNLKNHPWFYLPAKKTGNDENYFWIFGLLLMPDVGRNLEWIRGELQRYGVETRRFFCPIHLQPVSKKFNIEKIGNLRNSEYLWNNGFYIPFGNGISLKEIDYVSECLWKIIK